MRTKTLSELIDEHLQNIWIQEKPGDKCFDYDESTMARLLAFITAADPDREEVRIHLLQCPRCRFVFSKMREVVATDSIKGETTP